MGDVNFDNGDNSITNTGVMELTSKEATSIIIGRAKKLVNKLLEDRRDDKPPFLPIEYARLKGIKKIDVTDLGDTSGILIRLNDGYVIKVNRNHSIKRQHFSCAHEIGHMLFDELGLIEYVRKIEYRTFNPINLVKIRGLARERLCDIAATELLMPEAIFKKHLLGFGLSISSIPLLSNVFKASIHAVALRIAEVCPESCVILQWQLWQRRGTKTLRLSNTKRKTYCTPVNSKVEPNSSVYKAFKTDDIVKSRQKFMIGNEKKYLSLESKGFGYGENRKVYSLVFLKG